MARYVKAALRLQVWDRKKKRSRRMRLRQRGIHLGLQQSLLERMTCLQQAHGNRKGLEENSGQRLSDEVRPLRTA